VDIKASSAKETNNASFLFATNAAAAFKPLQTKNNFPILGFFLTLFVGR
jgi:hypothetical protein